MLQFPKKMRLLSAGSLKTIAVVSMLIDHFAYAILYYAVLLPNAPIQRGTDLYTVYLVYRVMRGIGRTAFPIYCFMLVEGFFYTRSRLKYARNLAVFGLISEIPFDFAFEQTFLEFSYQNVYFTLLIGLLVIWAWDAAGYKRWYLQILALGGGMGLAYLLNTDYDYRGVLLIFVFYILRQFRVPQTIGGAVAMYWEMPAVIPAFLLLPFYSGERGRQPKYFFYAFYPCHLMILGGIEYLMLHLR